MLASTEISEHKKNRKSKSHLRSSNWNVVDPDGDSDNLSMSMSAVKIYMPSVKTCIDCINPIFGNSEIEETFRIISNKRRDPTK